MDGFWLDWVTFALRWLHVIVAIAWIGASFYFIWLDQSLVTPSPEKAERGLKGELWAIHGGGIYEVGKYRLAPPRMPEHLHWFKWEAYTTWLSGFALLLALYYTRADSYLIGATTWVQTAPAAIAASLLFLLATLALYELALRSPLQRHQAAFALLITGVVYAASWLAWQLFTPRAATLHVGAALATIMAGNVFLGIIPAQETLVAAIAAGTEPDPRPAALAKVRSTHNNYFTLPVLFCMLANHAPFFHSHAMAWLLLPCFAVAAAVARHYFNQRNLGNNQPLWLVAAAVMACLLVFASRPADVPAAASQGTAAKEEVAAILTTHCAACHAATPTFAGYASAPAGLVFDTPEALHATTNGMTPERVSNAIRSGYMPLGNMHAMTDKERAVLLAWIADPH
jgi:uncharacterized membrane protein